MLARALLILAALALPARSECLCKWVEPSRVTYRNGVYDWFPAQYWLFERDWNSDLGCWVYSQRQVSPWVWRETEVYVPIEEEQEP